MELETTVKVIGCLIIAILIFAIPCLTTVAFVLNWDGFLKTLFTILGISVIFITATALYDSLD